LYLFGLFDTGSTIVLVSDESATALSMGASSPGNTAQDVHIRLNGLAAIDPTTLLAPIGSPFAAAQAELGGIRVGIRTSPDVDLIGAPVANQVVALMDNSTTITRGPYFFGDVSGPDITFFNPGDVGIPTPEIILDLTAFGVTGTSGTDNATAGQRYLLDGVVFNAGANTGGGELLYDSGTTVTIIGDPLAGSLGLTAGAGTFDCLTGTSNGYTIDSIVMTGAGGDYTVNNASVCWNDSSIITAGPSGSDVAAVIGSNLFDQLPVLFDGPNATLGIGLAAVPAPATLLLTATGLVLLGLGRRRVS
jgi:hypothetical protein